MFHVEMRMGMTVVREFNLSNERLWLGFLAPLMAGRDFSVEGHDFTPRKTRLKVYEGPELRPDQLSMGRGWQNVERTATEVTERVLELARQHSAAAAPGPAAPASAAPAPAAPAPAAPAPAAPAPADARPAAADLLRERLLGRIAAGPIPTEEILTIARELMPQATDQERREAAHLAVWTLLERGAAQLTPSGR